MRYTIYSAKYLRCINFVVLVAKFKLIKKSFALCCLARKDSWSAKTISVKFDASSKMGSGHAYMYINIVLFNTGLLLYP